MKSKPEVSISLNGYDCTGQGYETSADDLDLVSEMFRDAAAAIRAKNHGALECSTLLNIGIDFGGPFNDKTVLPILKRYRKKK